VPHRCGPAAVRPRRARRGLTFAVEAVRRPTANSVRCKSPIVADRQGRFAVERGRTLRPAVARRASPCSPARALRGRGAGRAHTEPPAGVDRSLSMLAVLSCDDPRRQATSAAFLPGRTGRGSQSGISAIIILSRTPAVFDSQDGKCEVRGRFLAEQAKGKKRKNAPGAGRPAGPTMPCGWGCGKLMRAGEIRAHFRDCPKRPGRPAKATPTGPRPSPGEEYLEEFSPPIKSWRDRDWGH
jgi:hypothetical protein